MKLQTNYLKNTIPELEDEFVDVLQKIPIFEKLPQELLHHIFEYSKFINLKGDERLIEQGEFDQEIFILIHGSLSVLLREETGREELIDILRDSFTLLGERSLLGEPRGACIKADGNAFLLGIDLSSLPDILGGIEAPESREPDEAYEQSSQMYLVFSLVLTQRLGRLVRDQYKLKQRLLGFQKRHQVWTHNFLLARIFNQMYADELPQTLVIREIIKKRLKSYNLFSPEIRGIMLSPRFSTKKLYMELMRMDTLDKIDNLTELILTLVEDITDYLKNQSEYSGLFEINLLEIHEELKGIAPLSDYLNALHSALAQSSALSKPLSKAQFLKYFTHEDKLNPVTFVQMLKAEGWIPNYFSLVHTLFLVCQQAIYAVSRTNNHIRDYIKFLHTYDSPHQDKRGIEAQKTTLIQQFQNMFQQQETALSAIEVPPTPSFNNNVDDLLSSLGL
ncbi:cyclic nucleotide-binding domain-containing protein [Deltaproteobacteria bacterium TL4]